MIDKYINSVIQGDCLEVMRSIPDNSVDVTFADPPFNLGKKYNGYKDNCFYPNVVGNAENEKDNYIYIINYADFLL